MVKEGLACPRPLGIPVPPAYPFSLSSGRASGSFALLEASYFNIQPVPDERELLHPRNEQSIPKVSFRQPLTLSGGINTAAGVTTSNRYT